MNLKLKERLIGVMVLLSLAIIFLPSLFYRDERVELDTTSLIPPKPTINPIVIRPPQKTDMKPAPKPDVAFQPPEIRSEELAPSSNEVKTKQPVKQPTFKPSLNTQGLPNAWVIQLGSFKSQTRADELTKKLLADDHKAYSRAIKTGNGEFFRVLVGPYIDKARAFEIQKKLDQTYKVKSRLLTFSPESS